MAQVTVRIDAAVRARFFRGLADPARLAILDVLEDGEIRATDIAARAGLSRSNASKHLACLRDCGLVEARQDWRHVHYRLADGVATLLGANDAFLYRIAERVAACERPEMGDR